MKAEGVKDIKFGESKLKGESTVGRVKAPVNSRKK